MPSAVARPARRRGLRSTDSETLPGAIRSSPWSTKTTTRPPGPPPGPVTQGPSRVSGVSAVAAGTFGLPVRLRWNGAMSRAQRQRPSPDERVGRGGPAPPGPENPRGPDPVVPESAYDGRSLPLAGAARDPRGMGQPPPTTRHRVPGGGEPGPQGAAGGAPPPADRRPAPTPRGEGAPHSVAGSCGRSPRS